MKVGIYTSLKIDPESIHNIEAALLANPKVSEVFILNPNELEITSSQKGAVFSFNGKVVNKENVDLVIVRGGFGDINGTIQFAKYCIENGIRIFDNNLHSVKYLINKKSDTIKLAQAGIPIPRTKVYTDISQIQRDELTFPLIVKTSNTGQGKNVRKVDSFEEIISLVEEFGKKLNAFLFQEFIDYEKDLRLVVIGDEVVAAMERIPGEGEFRANFSLGGAVEKFDAPEDMKTLAVRAAKACECEMSGIDVLVDKQGKYWILEANRTPGLTGISKALGFNVAEKLVSYLLK
jgi:RimK family alpha-L-glutamate ligase